jgi:uncharacterized SAM-binding protein YcdF (DUF218 family)
MWLIKQIGAPGSISLLVVCAAIGLLLRFAWPRRSRVARVWLVLVGGMYLLLAWPPVADGIARLLPAVPTAVAPSTPGRIDTLVVFDGDNRRARALAGVEVNAAAHPSAIWVLGNGWLVEPMSAGGVPRDRIWHDAEMATTRDQMARLQRLISERPTTTRLAVIVSRFQAPRVAGLLEAQNMTVALIASPSDRESPPSGLARFVPSYTALRNSREALYEVAAVWYYRRQGWIK